MKILIIGNIGAGKTTLGNKIKEYSIEEIPIVYQWSPYEFNTRLSPKQAIENLINYLDKYKSSILNAKTQIIIVPGYEFKFTKGLVTNFHLPKSTLLLLVAAFVRNNWKRIYQYALVNDFRFLSYGDASFLIKPS